MHTLRLHATTARALSALFALTYLISTSALALEEGLLGFWSFDEGAGLESANLAGEHRVVFVEDEASLPEWVDGKIGSALHFDEMSYAKIEDYYGVGGNTPRTIAMWLKTDWQVPGGATALIGWGLNESGRRWHFKFEHTTQSIRTENQSGQNFGSDIMVTDDEWHHVASVLPEGGTTIGEVQLYVDGVLLDVNGNGAQTVDTATDPDEGAVEVTIGMGFLGTTKRFSLVTLDELAIWERGLSQEEIQIQADGGRPISEGDPNLIAPRSASLGQVTAVPPTHEGSFAIRNLGDENALTVTGIDVDGANADRFTVLDFPASVAPSESGEVRYRFDSRGESGGFLAELVIRSNDEEEAEFRVGVSASVINRNGPVAHYRLDEEAGAGEVNDTSGWDRHGAVGAEGTVVQGVEPGLAEGAAVRVADGGRVEVPGSGFEPFESFTIASWVQPDSVTGMQTLSAFGPATPDWAVLSAEGAVAWSVAGELKTATDPVLTAGQSAHVAVVYAPEELVIYVEGVLVLSEADPDPVEIQLEDSLFSLGSVGGALPFAGVIDDVQWYGRALAAEDIQWLVANPGKPIGGPVDSDGDGLSDGEEVNDHQTDPQDPDSDDDGLLDGVEIADGTNPLDRDSDGGGTWDGFERGAGTDPNNGEDDPAVWTVTTYKSQGTLDSLTQVLEMLADNTVAGDPILRQHRVVNFLGTGGGGNFDEDAPFDNIEAVDAADIDDFAVVGTTEIFVAESGIYTFGFNSDDGGRLSVSGIVVAEFAGTRGAADSLGAVSLAPGYHTVEVIQFERGGGSALEVFWDPEPGDSSDGFSSNRHQLLAASEVVREDSDGDGLDDHWENAVFGDLSRDGTGDEDGDGLNDAGEQAARTDPNVVDTDGDGLNDGAEVNEHGTLPLVVDTDGDKRSDGEEINGDFKSDPLVEDTDGDGFRDGFEAAEGSDPSDASDFPDDIGEPDLEWLAIEALPTFDGFQGGLDQRDVTFRVWIDFDPATVTEDEREMIWESGGGTVGFSLVYENGDRLVLRAAGNGGNTVTEVAHTLTADQIAAGELSVIWTFDVDNGDPATGQTIALFVDEVLVGEQAGDMDPDWTGSNAASFGEASTSFAAGGGNTALANGVAFASGEINLQKGLQMFSDFVFDPDAKPQPPVEPAVLEILTVAATDGGVVLSWRSEEGADYDVEHSSDLQTWTKINGAAVSGGAGGETAFEDDEPARVEAARGFYRALEAP